MKSDYERQHTANRTRRGSTRSALTLALVAVIAVAGLLFGVPAALAAAPGSCGLAVPLPAVCFNQASFVGNVTIPDNTVFLPGTGFLKTWRFRNSGTCSWGPGYRLQLVSGNGLGSANYASVGNVAPGGVVDISAQMVAPSSPGIYLGVWQMADATGQWFGPSVTVLIQVQLPAAPPTAAPIPGATVDLWVSRIVANAGEQVTVRAQVSNVRAAWLDGEPVVNNFREKTVTLCDDTTFRLEAEMQDGRREVRTATVTVNGSCASPKADLEIRELRASSTNPVAGQAVHFTARMRNAGDRDARGFELAWRPGDSSPFILVAEHLNLNAGGNDLTVEWDHVYVAPGGYQSEARIDWNDDVDESDEGDNRRQLTINVREAPGPEPSAPELHVTSLRANTTSPRVGQNVELTAILRNSGNVEARNFSLAWRPKPDEQYLRITDGLTLVPGEEQVVQWTYSFDRSGTYDTQALADPENRVRERDDGNNSAGLRIKVRAPQQPSSNVDLSVIYLESNNRTPRLGQTIHLTAVIRNSGTGVANGFAVGWRPAGNSQYIRIATGLIMQPNTERTIEWDYTVARRGWNDSQFVVDLYDEIEETDENNNTMGLRMHYRD